MHSISFRLASRFARFARKCLRFARLTCREFELLFSAFADGARRLLGESARVEWEYAAQHVDWEYAARNVTEAVIDEMSQESDPDDGGAP